VGKQAAGSLVTIDDHRRAIHRHITSSRDLNTVLMRESKI
jgi:hypothetical protein